MSKQLILTELYPGSPDLHTIVTEDEEKEVWGYKNSKGFELYLSRNITRYHQWKPYEPIKLLLPLGSFVAINQLLLNRCILYLEDIVFRHGTFKVLCKKYNFKGECISEYHYLSVTIFNEFYNNGDSEHFETLEEAIDFKLENLNLLSIQDISTIYSSATNPNYAQADQLKQLIKSKLYE